MKSHILIAMLTVLFSLSVLSLPSAAAEAERPNILFIIFDDWGWQHAGAYGCTWVKTPNFDRVAREGVLFKNCFTSNPKCDMLDYAVEVEYADQHIGRALRALEDAGELDRTLIVVTSDHGMPFPYVKGQIFEDGFHLPLAMRWGAGIKPGRVVEDFINVRDFAATYLELAGLKPHAQMSGRSLVDVLRSEKSGWIDAKRNVMLVGKERHDLGRPNDWGYPVRAIRTTEFLYTHNYFPDRWPACNPETDFGNCDPGPSKEVIKSLGGYYYELTFGKRPADMLFRLTDDPQCVRNLANDPAFAPVMEQLRTRMLAMLREEQDPRALGNGAIFDTYKYVAGRQKAYDTWQGVHRRPNVSTTSST